MNEQIQTYLDTVCQQVKYQEVHDEIRRELGSHLEEAVEKYTSSGMAEAAAVNAALTDMGDPVLVGQQLNKTHQPQTEWGLLIATLLFVLLGCWAMYAIEVGMGSGFRAGFFISKMVWSLVGLALATVLIFVDYRRLRRYSSLLYAVTLGGPAFLAATAPTANGSLRVISYTPILFAVALAGIFTDWDWNRPHALPKGMGLLAAPLLLYLALPAFMEGVEFAAVFAILFWRSRPHRQQAAAMAGVGLMGAGIAAFRVWNTSYMRYRLISLLTDPAGEGYMTHQSLLTLQQAGWWGQGMAKSLPGLPGRQSELVFTFLVYNLGWIAGAAICLLILFFLKRLVSASHSVRDSYGANLVAAISTLFAFRFGWNLLMSVGLLPMAGVDLPFISYGKQGAVQLALVGLVLSVFRRKEIIRTAALPQ